MKVPYVDISSQYQSHKDELLASIDKVLSSGRYVLGDEVEKFESAFAHLCKTKHAISVANGTDALVLSLKALDVGSGDEVITVSNSWISTVSCIVLAGARPVFVDVNDDYNLNFDLLENCITNKTKAIIPVHLTGKCSDMNPIMEIAKKHNIFVIEDAAQAVGAKYFSHFAGSMGDVGCFSLHPLKNLNAAGDAGIITTNNDQRAQKLKLLRNHGLVSRDEIAMWGHNSRLDAIQAAILNFKIGELSTVISKRRRNAQIYRHRLGSIVSCPKDSENCFDTYHLFIIQCDRRDQLKQFLKQNEISTAIHYPTPAHLQSVARSLGYLRGSLPNTEKQADRILSLPVHHMLTESQVEYVCDKIIAFYSK